MQNEELCVKNDEFCITNEELCVKNEELCVKNDEFCITNDEFCRDRTARAAACGQFYVHIIYIYIFRLNRIFEKYA